MLRILFESSRTHDAAPEIPARHGDCTTGDRRFQDLRYGSKHAIPKSKDLRDLLYHGDSSRAGTSRRALGT